MHPGPHASKFIESSLLFGDILSVITLNLNLAWRLNLLSLDGEKIKTKTTTKRQDTHFARPRLPKIMS